MTVKEKEASELIKENRLEHNPIDFEINDRIQSPDKNTNTPGFYRITEK